MTFRRFIVCLEHFESRYCNKTTKINVTAELSFHKCNSQATITADISPV